VTRLLPAVLGLTLLSACTPEPVRAQSAPTPELLLVYAQLGAATLGLKSMEHGRRLEACYAYQHLLYLEQRDTRSNADTFARTRRLISFTCQ
jgi:hypothetical protein